MGSLYTIHHSPGATVLHISGKENIKYEELCDLVLNHFTTEDFGVKLSTNPIESDDDARARGLLESLTRRVGDRFETGLLWKTDAVKLPNSYNMTLGRLLGVETKMKRDKKFADQYKAIIDSYIQKGYAKKM